MALKRVYATAEEIPANIRDLYVERNGHFVLEVEGTVAVEDFNRVQSALEKEKTVNQQVRSELGVARTEEAAVLEARRLGIRAGAEPDLRNRARQELTLTDDGKTAKRGTDGKLEPVSVTEWVAQQAQSAAHLFSEGEGTGAAGVCCEADLHMEEYLVAKPQVRATWLLLKAAGARRGGNRIHGAGTWSERETNLRLGVKRRELAEVTGLFRWDRADLIVADAAHPLPEYPPDQGSR